MSLVSLRSISFLALATLLSCDQSSQEGVVLDQHEGSDTSSKVEDAEISEEAAFALNTDRFQGNRWISLARPNVTIYQGSDLLFSKRLGHKSAPNMKPYVDAMEPNRLVWHYPIQNLTRSTNNQETPSEAMLLFKDIDPAMQCSIPLFVPLDSSAEPVDLRCLDLSGNPLQADWETEWTVSRADVTKDAYITLQKAAVGRLVRSGCKVLQQDSISQNYETFAWGGCFSADADRKFIEFLRDRYTTSQLESLSEVANMNAASETFSIKNYFIAKGAKSAPNKNLVKWMADRPDSELLHLYREFSNLKTLEYLQIMKSTAKEAAGTYVPLSGNVAFYTENYPLYQVLDFITSEWVNDRKTPKGFVEMMKFSERMGKQLVGTPATDSVPLLRTMFASSYALGIHMLLPYDVYTGGTPTHFTAPTEEFRYMADFVRDTADDLNDSFGIETYGKMPQAIASVQWEPARDANGNTVPPSTRPVTKPARLAIRHSRMDDFKNIPMGAVVVINGIEYPIVSPSGIGVIYVSDAHRSVLTRFQEDKLSIEKILLNPAVASPQDYNLVQELTSLGMPLDTAPRVKSVDFGISKAGKTTVRLTSNETSFPKGTKFVFADTDYAATNISTTGVGNLYFDGDLISKVFPGQALSSYQKPNQTEVNFLVQDSAADNVRLQNRHFNLLVSVRRKLDGSTKRSIMHVVNWQEEPRSTRLNVRFQDVFGFSPAENTTCTMKQAGVPNPVSVKPVQRTDDRNRYDLLVSNLRVWAQIKCRQ